MVFKIYSDCFLKNINRLILVEYYGIRSEFMHIESKAIPVTASGDIQGL
jgi:hypothetical protein